MNDEIRNEIIKIELFFRNKIDEYNRYVSEIDKNQVKLDDLNAKSNKFLMIFFHKRRLYHAYIKSKPELFEYFEDLCRKDFLFWIVFDGIAKDINRNPKEEQQPVIPYYHQLEFIRLLSTSKKHLHIEKTRRQGASLIVILFMQWQLLFGHQILNFTTHKDKKSLFMAGDDTNSAFGKILFGLKKSFFFKNENLKISPNFQDVRIKYLNNFVSGEVLSPSTAVGFQANGAFIDEIDPVCEEYPNQAYKITSGFASSVNRMILFSTYRSTEYPFYKIKERNDDANWDFLVLDWKEHPLCNDFWYDSECAKLNYDPILIARELDHNPTMAIKGRVFYRLTESNFITNGNIFNDYKKLIMADFGGGTSATALIFAYYSTKDKILYLHKALKTTVMDAKDIKKFVVDCGFFGSPLVGDRSALFQSGAYKYDWKSLLTAEGFKFFPVDNTKMEALRSQVNLAMLNKEILINKNEIIFRDFWTYTYKNDGIEKNESSHIGDALCYGYRHLYQSPDTNYTGIL